MDNLFYTYAYLREDGTPYYIGKGKGKRAFQKEHNAPRPPEDRILFLKKNLTEEEAFRHEVYMIAVFGRKDKGEGILWNFTDGGQGCSGRVVGEETKRKIAEKNKGNSYGLGHRHSEESKRKMSEASKGRPKSEEHRKKLSEANKGKKPSEANREALRAKNKGNKYTLGRKHSEETKRKMSEAHRRRKQSL